MFLYQAYQGEKPLTLYLTVDHVMEWLNEAGLELSTVKFKVRYD